MFMSICKNLTKTKGVKLYSDFRMSSEKCTVAVAQFTATNNKDRNFQVVNSLVEAAVAKHAKLVFLPEACDYLGENVEETKALSEPLDGALMNQYRDLAKKHTVWLSIGGFHELVKIENGDKFYNCHVVIDGEGAIKETYRKIHLFDVSLPEANVFLKESDTTLAGFEIKSPVNTPAGPLALAICYDLRFPELSLLQRRGGASILTYPSAFTYATGKLHWEVLLRSRAIETQSYVIAAAQYGKHNSKRISWGQALIVDPRGVILAECPKYDEGHPTNQSLALAEIDLNAVRKIRREMPVSEHRRDDVYQLKLLKSVPAEKRGGFMFADKVIDPNVVFYNTRYSFAFTNIRCVVPGHVLIATRRSVRKLTDLNADELADLFQVAVQVQKVMETVQQSHSSTICVQDGKEAGQTVPHVHVHILPRKVGDFQRNDDIYEKLAKHDRDDSSQPVRSLSEMIEEADKLRPYFNSAPLS